ncbi:MAG: DUF1841 family protein [Gammaproteobacteria bacterium]|nr:DUF1841 family protein [Gammaproteobacteria bacterium]
MSAFGAYTREELRRAYAEAWAKASAGSPLTPLEALIADVIGLHPEYQAVVADTERAQQFELAVGGGRENPFLHMGLHIAVREQLAIDRPPGVRALHRDALVRLGDPHAAEHVLMEALGRTLWDAQRSGAAPDERRYLALARDALER